MIGIYAHLIILALGMLCAFAIGRAIGGRR